MHHSLAPIGDTQSLEQAPRPLKEAHFQHSVYPGPKTLCSGNADFNALWLSGK